MKPPDYSFDIADHVAFLSEEETVALLGVEKGTLTNWMRQGLIESHQYQSRRMFLREKVLILREDLFGSGSGRLQQRANRKYSRKRRIPPSLKNIFLELVENSSEAVAIENLLFTFSQRLVQKAGHSESVLVCEDWRTDLDFRGEYRELQALPDDIFDFSGKDPGGRLYQLLADLGSRSSRGLFFTAGESASGVLSELFPLEGEGAIWDPCCGSGAFLVSLMEAGVPASRIWGTDNDFLSVRLAQVNLFLAGVSDPQIRVIHADSLSTLNTCKIPPLLDLIVTNPPWGRYADGVVAGKRPTGEDAFVRFLRLGLSRCRRGGRLAYLLPESVLGVKRHAKIRKELRQNGDSISFRLLGRIFPGVYSRAVLLVLRKNSSPRACEDGSPFLMIKEPEKVLVEKMEQVPHRKLGESCQWLMGIVTGDNNRFVRFSPEKGTVPVVAGPDIGRNTLIRPSRHLIYNRDALQQCGPDNLYQQPKILYRFITEDPVFAWDREGQYMLNSVNAFIPDGSIWSLRDWELVLNHPLIRFYYRKKFGGVKVLKRALSALPVPILEEKPSLLSPEDLSRTLSRFYGLTPLEISLVDKEFGGKENPVSGKQTLR